MRIGREGEFYNQEMSHAGFTFWHGRLFGPLNEEMFAEVFWEGMAECEGIDKDCSLQICGEGTGRFSRTGKDERCRGDVM